MDKEYITYYQNPKIEILFGFYGGKPIPTKKDQFKALKAFEIDESGNEIELKNFYEKKEDKSTIEAMKSTIANCATKAFKGRGIIKRPAQVEVILSFSVKEKRFKIVDLDNLSKTVLDGLTGVAFEDDSQVSSLIVNKHVHPMKIDGVFIGVTELNEERRGFGEDIKLYQQQEWK